MQRWPWFSSFLPQVYALIGGFCGSPVNFHAKDGSGYKFLGDIVLQLDKLNPQVIYFPLLWPRRTRWHNVHWPTLCFWNPWPFWLQVASRMVSAFSRWRRYDDDRQALAKVFLLLCLWRWLFHKWNEVNPMPRFYSKPSGKVRLIFFFSPRL